MRMIDIIKTAAQQGIESGNPVNVLEGTITKSNPLEVFVEQRFTLTADFLMVTESLQELNITIAGQSYCIRQGLQNGDTVLMLRKQGGQQYVVLDRVMET